MADHYPCKCTFCNAALSFTIQDGQKVLDKACECSGSKSYFSAEKVAKRADAERKELERLVPKSEQEEDVN